MPPPKGHIKNIPPKAAPSFKQAVVALGERRGTAAGWAAAGTLTKGRKMVLLVTQGGLTISPESRTWLQLRDCGP